MKKENKCGFTLVELLAVIVILAVIAVIATPMILGVIEKAKRGSVEASAMGYIDALENTVMMNILDTNNEYEFSPGVYGLDKWNIEYKGMQPSKGRIIIFETDKIGEAILCMDGYYVYYDGTTAKIDHTKNCNTIVDPTVPTTEACFEITNQEIITYYDHENNDSTKPACPRDVVIPETVKVIGTRAFQDKQLTSVVLPSSITYIRSWAFFENQLTSVVIPNSITGIGSLAFQNNQLTRVVIPSSMSTIDNNIFANNRIKSVTIPNGITSIGNNAFANNLITSVDIPDSVISIGSQAFQTNLITQLTLSKNLITIEHNAFYGNQLTSIVIPNSVTSIGDIAFSHNKLKHVKIEGKTNSNNFTSYGSDIWGWEAGYGDSNIEWNSIIS